MKKYFKTLIAVIVGFVIMTIEIGFASGIIFLGIGMMPTWLAILWVSLGVLLFPLFIYGEKVVDTLTKWINN